MLMMYISQMGYIHLRGLININSPELLDISDADFIDSRNKGDVLINNADVKINRKIRNGSTVFGYLEHGTLFVRNNKIYGRFEFGIDGDSATGSCSTVTILHDA